MILKGISGSGKSTLLSLIGTLQKPTSGDIKIDEESIAKLPDLHASNFRAKNLGFIFQAYNLFNELSVKDNISIPLIPLGFSQKDIDEKVSEALKLSTANLDLNNSIRFVEILKDLKNLNKTIIVASHDPIFDDLDFVDKIIHIKNGIICE